MGPDKGVKSRLSQAFTRGARLDSNSRPTMQISNPLPSATLLRDNLKGNLIAYPKNGLIY